MLSVDEAKIRVARGAAHLDQVRPRWFTDIDLGTLRLSSCERCVLGQLCGGYWEALAWLHWPGSPTTGWDVSPDASAHGFALSIAETSDAAYQLLQDAWIAEIATRQCEQGDSEPTVQPDDVRGGLEAPGSPVLTLRAS